MPSIVNWYGSRVSEEFLRDVSFLVEAFALEVWSEAKKNHTFKNRTGQLEKSIRVAKLKTRSNKFVVYRVSAGVGQSTGVRSFGSSPGKGGSTKAYYALYVELGTVKMAAKPFLRPAFIKHKNKFRGALRKLKRKYNMSATIIRRR